jgi:hypothetical protein
MSGLLVPAYLYGTHREVAGRVRARVRRALRDSAIHGSEIEMLDPRSVPGLLVVNTALRMTGDGPHFWLAEFCARYWRIASEAGGLSETPRVYCELASTAFGALMLMGQDSFGFFRSRESSSVEFVRICARHWPELTRIGPRYSAGSSAGTDLWAVALSLKSSLGRIGVLPAELPQDPVVAAAAMTKWGELASGEGSGRG